MYVRGALGQLKVLLLGGVGPAPFCAMVLADHGADVLVVERPGGAAVADRAVDGGIDILGRGCARVVLDLKSAEGTEAARTLAAHADVVLEGFRPGVTERLGLGPDDCTDVNPRLVYGRMTGYGQTGPDRDRAGHDINYIAAVGALGAIGRRGGPPQVPLNLVADYGGGGMVLAFGVLAALYERDRSGKGQVVDAAMVDGAALLMASMFEKLSNGRWTDERGTNPLDTGAPQYDVYETADGGWMAVGAREPVFHRRFLDAIGLTGEPTEVDPVATGERHAAVAHALRRMTRSEWTEVFAQVDACVSPVLSMREAAKNAHLRARGTYRERDGHAEPGPAPRLSRTPGTARPPRGRVATADAISRWNSS